MGDQFLYDTFSQFQAAKVEANLDRRRPPYLHEYYNVKFLLQPPLSNLKFVETRILNSIIEGLNEYERLPRYIIIILDTDLIASVDTEFGVKISLTRLMKYLINQINWAMEVRRENIRNIKPGGIASSAEPRVIFTSVVQRLKNTDPRKHHIYKLVSKANKVIEEAVRLNDKFCHLLYVESLNEYVNFDYNGKLTGSGRSQYWKEIDDQMKKLDRRETDLVPKPRCGMKGKFNNKQGRGKIPPGSRIN